MSFSKVVGTGLFFFLVFVSENFATANSAESCDYETAHEWKEILGDNYLEGPNPSGGLNENDEFARCVLNRHNHYREAVGLTSLKWNKTIADVAFETSTYFSKLPNH